MFTNWLTGTTGGAAASTSTNQNSNSSDNQSAVQTHAANSTNNVNNGGHLLMSTPPDVILEVGTVPSTIRFVAHSIVLGMHSGYLRSAIRLDERTNPSNSTSSASTPDIVLYLGNVTAEQFAPLLTYMYTGYLDLNIENIFGVLLATHVLHMPRALEICRAFLARAQTEGYLGARLNMTNPNNNTNNNGNGKIIRPIASKPAIPNFSFLPALPRATATITLSQQSQQSQQQHLLPSTQMLVNFKGYPTTSVSVTCENEEEIREERANSEEIDVDKESTRALSVTNDSPKNENNQLKDINDNNDNDDDEDQEVFIDSSNTDTDNDEAEVIIGVTSKRQNSPKMENQATKSRSTKKIDSKGIRQQQQQHQQQRNSSKLTASRRDKRRTAASSANSKQRSSSGLQIAKAPIPASQLDANEGSKVIIDVASCDGPVRFRRILNTAYGHKPEDFTTSQMPERSQQSVSYSFHQQMARTINQQQRQQMQQQSGGEESENSECSSGGGGGNGNGAKNTNKCAANDIYVCVYCKHTFKSQYCYQKHAKRHLNPLNLHSSAPGERCGDKTSYNNTATTFSHNTIGGNVLPMQLSTAKPHATEMLRREVRPLDMNVQYYPCKTCGSKFPSYYFVHKHRKMCHADEETNAAKENESVNNEHVSQREDHRISSHQSSDNVDSREEREAKNEH